MRANSLGAVTFFQRRGSEAAPSNRLTPKGDTGGCGLDFIRMDILESRRPLGRVPDAVPASAGHSWFRPSSNKKFQYVKTRAEPPIDPALTKPVDSTSGHILRTGHAFPMDALRETASQNRRSERDAVSRRCRNGKRVPKFDRKVGHGFGLSSGWETTSQNHRSNWDTVSG